MHVTKSTRSEEGEEGEKYNFMAQAVRTQFIIYNAQL